jgi:selenocysteine lyase/cysteine desulfurase
MVEADVEASCLDGRTRRYVNLDYAASTPAMAGVLAVVQDFLACYGGDQESELATVAHEAARAVVAGFVGAHAGTAVLVRDSSEAIDVLAGVLPAGARVLCVGVEDTRPWRGHDVAVLPVPTSGAELVERCEHALRVARSGIDLVAVSGASSITGEVWPLNELAAVAHHYGAKLFVDAAQLAAHRAIDMTGTGIDFLALSGDMLYAPFGCGALVACGRALDHHEAGSPNVVGAVALGAACRTLDEVGMDRVAANEHGLLVRLAAGLASVPGLRQPAMWNDPSADRIGLATFDLEGYRHSLLAAILSAEHAIGVGRAPSGAVRASFGLGTTAQDVDRLVDALAEIASAGPRWGYAHDGAHDAYRPAPAVRALPRTPRYEPAAASASARPLRS